MKIALQVGVPEQEQLTAFFNTLEERPQDGWNERDADAAGMIAAYDCGHLVGIGSRIEGPGHTPELEVYIAPGYERRGIGEHMKKLMLPRDNALGTAAG